MVDGRRTDPFVRGPLGGDSTELRAARELYVASYYGEGKPLRDTSLGVSKLEFPEKELLRKSDQTAALFDYQEDLAERILETATRSSSRALLALPTGGGKTRTAVAATLRLISSGRAENVLWIAPSKELLDQAFETTRVVWRSLARAPTVFLNRCHASGTVDRVLDAPSIQFITPQMLGSRSRTGGLGQTFDLVVFDEAHFAIAPTFARSVLSIVNTTAHKAPLIGLSATPGRRDERGTNELASLFGGNLLTSKLLRPNALQVLRARGVLADVRFELLPIPKVVGQRVAVSSLAQLAASKKHLQYDRARFWASVAGIEKAVSAGQTLVFCASIMHAHALSAALNARSQKTRVVSAATPLKTREQILADFGAKRVAVLLNKSLLATGYDCPSVSQIVIATAVGSPILFEQIVGRASRGPAVGGNEKAVVASLDNLLQLHGMPASYHRFEDYDWS